MFAKSIFIKHGLVLVLSALFLSACAAATPAPTQAPLATAPTATPEPQPPAPTVEMPATRPFEVVDVQVQVGLGSPIPVDVVVNGPWPDLCAQVARIDQQLDGSQFTINLLASPADPACPPDLVGISYRIAVPLNMSGLAFGTYRVVVNGFPVEFTWPPVSSEPIPVENLGLTIAYVGLDGNLWLADAAGGPPRQLTSDAAAPGNGGAVVSYDFPRISSDGRYIAARRDAGVTVPEGVKYQFGLWVYDTETGESRSVYDNPDLPPAGFDWKPGTHLLAYGIGTDPNYFVTRGKPNADLATGIFAVDLDSGATDLLVAPTNGYTLILPTWSPDGRYLSFDEVIYMEGRGPFAYYDFETQEYISWDEPIGVYDWSPDGSQLAYDYLTYTATGAERIYTRPLVGGSEVQVSPEPAQGYAFLPVYSPDGTQLAYLLNPGGPDSQVNTLVVQDLASGEVRELGTYESVWNLDWSSDGRALVFSAGPHQAQWIYTYDLVNSIASQLAQGSQPTLAKP